MNWTVFAVGISILALVISSLTLYHSWLKPFKLVLIPGNPLFGKSPVAGQEDRFGTTPIVPIEFVNTGARQGSVQHFLIRVTTRTASWILRPHYFCAEFGISCVQSEKREAFHPFSLSARERVYKIVLFNPWAHPGLPIPTFKSPSDIPDKDTWVLDYYVLDSSSPEYRLAYTQQFELTAKQMFDQLFIPDDKSIRNALNKLLGSI